MMRLFYLGVPVLLVALLGCSGKNVRIGGMMCPEGQGQDQMKSDPQECRFYGPAEQDAAAKASLPKKPGEECVKCLEQKGYNISQ